MINVQIINNATPAVRKLLRKYPEITFAARAMTVAKHRRILRRFVARNTEAKKKMLDTKGVTRVMNSGQPQSVINRHVHRNTRAYSGMRGRNLGAAAMFAKSGEDAHEFGYIDGDAIKWVQELSDGKMRTEKKGIARRNPVVTEKIKAHFGDIGLGLKKTTKVLKTTPRPVVESYFRVNQSRIQRDFAKYFVKQLHKKAGELFR